MKVCPSSRTLISSLRLLFRHSPFLYQLKNILITIRFWAKTDKATSQKTNSLVISYLPMISSLIGDNNILQNYATFCNQFVYINFMVKVNFNLIGGLLPVFLCDLGPLGPNMPSSSNRKDYLLLTSQMGVRVPPAVPFKFKEEK